MREENEDVPERVSVGMGRLNVAFSAVGSDDQEVQGLANQNLSTILFCVLRVELTRLARYYLYY